MTDEHSTGSTGRWWTPDWMLMGPVAKSSIDYAFKAWIGYHLVEFWDPAWFDVPFVAVAIFAVLGLARGLDRQLQADRNQEGP